MKMNNNLVKLKLLL